MPSAERLGPAGEVRDMARTALRVARIDDPRLQLQCHLLIPAVPPALEHDINRLRQRFGCRAHHHAGTDRIGGFAEVLDFDDEASVNERNGRANVVQEGDERGGDDLSAEGEEERTHGAGELERYWLLEIDKKEAGRERVERGDGRQS